MEIVVVLLAVIIVVEVLGVQDAKQGEEIVEITLRRVTNGWLVIAGCAQLVFSDTQMYGGAPLLAHELSRFIQNPRRVWVEYDTQHAQRTPEPQHAQRTPGLAVPPQTAAPEADFYQPKGETLDAINS